MQVIIWPTLEEYKSIKENAYGFVMALEPEKLIKFTEGLEFSNEVEEKIYITTLLYPNDMQLFEELSKTLNLEVISKKLNIPTSILKMKANEYARYKFWDIIKPNTTLKTLATKLATYEPMEEAEKIIDSKLK